ncbi:hypothetical protein PybrP1_005380 [[Pythium] brassicae (nom. inval.)]|nr:hypothetical protein PybrP1_005380 [[Pythium] brassicae (nom. inval.)]
MSSCLEDDDGYDSVGEDAELELSCALHDLALRVKTFEENMRDRFRSVGGGDDDDDEIAEDIPEANSGHSAASPKRGARGRRSAATHRQRVGSGAKAVKQQPDDDDDGDDLYHDEADDDDDDDDDDGGYASDDEDDDDSAEDDARSGEKPREDWDFQEQKEELSEMRHNIALLLQSMKAEAKALAGADDSEPDASDDNQ